MKNQEIPQEGGETFETLDPVLEIKSIAENARERVEQEFSGTENTWLDCFTNDLFAIRLIIDMRLLTEPLREVAEKRYAELYTKVLDLQKIYATKKTIPPPFVQDELFSALNVLE